ncbi:MAG: UDP-2,4-diacetamido-2,4,6-trideoxy-beta-L-altropyranose hydrolase [Nitrospiria bacterium]
MNIVIRTDASIQLGSGHVMRCLTLADALRDNGAKVSFICRKLRGNLCDFIEGKKYQIYRLPENQNIIDDVNKDKQILKNRNYSDCPMDTNETQSILKNWGETIDWLIIDHYVLGNEWETQMRPYVKKIMVIDDLANRSHNCDLLLDQNMYKNMETRYDGLVPRNCKKLLGPQFALLRPEFKAARKNLRTRDGNIKRILIFFGGTDPTNETQKALEAIQVLNKTDIDVDVVVGASNPHKEQISRICANLQNTSYHCQVENMAELMVMADLAVGAGGSTTWERCCLGLPSIIIVVAKNQERIAMALEDAGTVWNLGWHSGVDSGKITESLLLATKSPEKLLRMGKRGRKIMGGNKFQGASYLANELLEGKYASA